MTPVATGASSSPGHAVDQCGTSWEGRRVAVVGIGRSGLAAAAFLQRIGARVVVTEAKDTEELRRTRERLLRSGIEAVELGGHTEQWIAQSDLLVVSPGVPESSRPLQWAARHRRMILSEIEIAFQFCPSPVVAVTGTNGKSTVVTLIAEVLNAAGRPAIACGNLGVPFSSVLDRLTPRHVAVVEVSSFQLLGCDQFRPRIGVLLNVGTNHLDRHQDPAAYLAAKRRLFQRQTSEDWSILNGTDPQVAAIGERLPTKHIWFGDNRSNPVEYWLAPETLRTLTDNLQAVLQVARVLGIPDPLTWQVMRSFRGLEHRLEAVATIHGVHFLNDSKSTTPESLGYALVCTSGPVVVIMGGRDKGLDFTLLAQRLRDERIQGIVLIGESRAKLSRLLHGVASVRECETLEEAVRTAAELAGPGTTVLFSPACASFDMFKDFEDRGRAFKAIVSAMRNSEFGVRSNGSLHSELRTPNSEFPSGDAG
jgi:UDP-N-acetylmuramoylalanine--D-glutamate ligase